MQDKEEVKKMAEKSIAVYVKFVERYYKPKTMEVVQSYVKETFGLLEEENDKKITICHDRIIDPVVRKSMPVPYRLTHSIQKTDILEIKKIEIH